jgi:protein O-GlcNAc transferase
MSDVDTRSPTDLVEAGRTLHRAGKLEEAEQLYAQALARDADCAEAHQLLAVIAGQRGRFDEAIAGFRRSIAIEGPTPDRLFNLAEAYRVHGAFQPALDAYNQALALDASYLDAYRNCAALVKDAAERAQAGADSLSAQKLRRLAAHYLLGLGHVCLRAGSVRDAEEAYRESTALDPGNAEACNCLGTIALEAARPVEAEIFYRRAHEIEPGSPLFLSNLGRSLLSQLRVTEARDLFRRAIGLDPSFDYARTLLEERILPWLHFRSDLSPGALFAAHQEWGRSEMKRAAKTTNSGAYANSRDPERPLRIIYIGLDISSRLMKACFEPLIANHDLGQVEVSVYGTAGGQMSDLRHFKELVSRFQMLKSPRPQEIVKRIRDAEVDVLVDVAGHMPHNRLDILAHKPAPIAVTWLGYPDTTGLSAVDYRITDDVSDPPGAEEIHTERLFRLRQGSLVYRPPERAPDVAALPARMPGKVTFGNFDDPRKISPETVGAWSAILRDLPDANLLLMAREFADDAFAAQLHSVLQAAGIGAKRVELRPAPENPDDTLRAYAEIDIALDTVPYNSDPAMVCESLWMGVPVVTLSGDRPCARTSTSLLSQVGLERLDSHTSREYAETAIELAGDLGRLRTLRSGMRKRLRVSPLMDERGFARRFEAALREMWREWCMSGD